MKQFNVQIGCQQCCMDYCYSWMGWKKTHEEIYFVDIRNPYHVCLKIDIKIYNITFLFLYECEILVIAEEEILIIYENAVLGRMF
jgi:hypothetical protein